MLYALVLGVHVIVCLVLIFVVLLQAGRGGGFSDMLGGGQPQSLFGTQTNAFMVRATEVCAVVFILTSLTLGMLSTQRGRSLVNSRSALEDIRATVPTVPQPPAAPPKVPEAPSPVPETAVPAEANAAS